MRIKKEKSMAFESKKNQMKQVLQEELPKNPPTESTQEDVRLDVQLEN